MTFAQLSPFASLWLFALTALAAVTDTRRGLIPNWLTLPTLALAPLAQLATSGPRAASAALLGALGCALVPLLMFGLRAMGGGDVKLFAALGALCGASLGLELQLISYVIAALAALSVAAWRGRLLAILVSAARLLWPPRRTRDTTALAAAPERLTDVRLGASIFAAVLLLGVRSVIGAP